MNYDGSMIAEEAQSSSDGSGLHSPVFASYGDSFRYCPPHYDYALSAQQPPILENTLELPTSRPAPPYYDPRLDFRYERRLPGNSYTRPPATAPPPMPAALSPEPSSPSERKEISPVVIACRQCRSRKIRCDSTRPVCNNCVRRSNECEYDLVPKRRGPDKRPGTRQRSCKKRPSDGSAPPPPKRKRTSVPVKENMQSDKNQYSDFKHEDEASPSSYRRPSSTAAAAATAPAEYIYDQGSYTKSSYPRQLDVNTFVFPDSHQAYSQQIQPPQYQHQSQAAQHQQGHSHSQPQYQPPQPSHQYQRYQHHQPQQTQQQQQQQRRYPATVNLNPPLPTVDHDVEQKVWWERILNRHSLRDIAAELTFLVNNTGHLLSFINLNFLLKRLQQHTREQISPTGSSFPSSSSSFPSSTQHSFSSIHPSTSSTATNRTFLLQPSFILAVLAMAKLMKSSALELGPAGVREAMLLAADAHEAFNDALRKGRIDAGLVEAALILALFESSAYPQHSANRATNALINLDDLIRNTGLTGIDRTDRDVCLFSPDTVPMVLVEYDCGPSFGESRGQGRDRDFASDGRGESKYASMVDNRKCSCSSPSPSNTSSSSHPTISLSSSSSSSSSSNATAQPDPFSNRPYILPWDNSWSDAQIYDEEVRRLCWAALTLISEYVAQCDAFGDEPPRFHLSDAANFGILFPGEVLDRMSPAFRASPDSTGAASPHASGPASPTSPVSTSPTHPYPPAHHTHPHAHSSHAHHPSPTPSHQPALSPKESVWALYCRSMLLWNFCNRFRVPSQSEERAENAHEAFLEAQAIEDALNCHRCNLDTGLMYMCREYVHNVRMLVGQALRAFHGLGEGVKVGPVFKRKQAEDWLFYEDQVIRRVNAVVHQLTTPPAGYQLTRRPFRINWFINQLAICLVLWTHDPTLDEALNLAKSILNPIDVLNALWPCPAIQQRCDALRQQLIEACNSRHIELPFAPSYSVPAFLRSS